MGEVRHLAVERFGRDRQCRVRGCRDCWADAVSPELTLRCLEVLRRAWL